MKKVSLVIPCYNEEGNVVPFFEAAFSCFEKSKYGYEMIFVNDGSMDQTSLQLQMLYKNNPNRISIIQFSRNFGKEAAILAGLEAAKGDYVSIIDADLQQRPELVLKMVDFLEKNHSYDAVAAYQEERIERKTVSCLKSLFYKLINRVCDIEFYAGASDFRTFRKKVVDAIISMQEYFRFSKGLFSWVGFETYYMPYKPEERNTGESKWSLKKLIAYALEGFISFTTFPLKVATYMGGVISMIAIAYMVVVIIQKLCFSVDVPGYPTIVVLVLFLGGIQLMILGIIGEYLARIYVQGKHRPIYIIKDVMEIVEEEDHDKRDE